MHIPIPNSESLKTALSLSSNPTHFATGGYKAVFKYTLPTGKHEALKAIYIPKAENEEDNLLRNQLVARARREIEALSQCNSASIVKLGSIPATPVFLDKADYLVYSEEMLAGRALVHKLSPGAVPLDYKSLKALLLALLEVIESLQTIGYLHRDIKPENIMGTGAPNRPFVLLDMGIAYKLRGTNITQGPNPPGTLRYMAPELLLPNYKDSMDIRSELYSAALTIYVLAAKQHPFAPAPEHDYATMYRIVNVRPNPLNTLRPDLPNEFCRIIDRCIRKRSALRYNNFDTIRQKLELI